MDIRAYTTKDLPAVVAIANRAWQGIRIMSRAALGDKICNTIWRYPDSVSKGIEMEEWLEKNASNALVCVEGERVVGFITYVIDLDNRIGTIGNNAADPDAGLKGIGQCMYRAVLEIFRARGLKVAYVFTGLDDAHAPARRAYERAGFNRRLTHCSYYMEL